MTRLSKAKKGIIIAVSILLAIALVFGGIIIYYNFIYNPYGEVSFNLEKARIVKDRIDKAQYLPNIALLSGSKGQSLSTSSPDKVASSNDLKFTYADFKQLEDELAVLEGTAVGFGANTVYGIKADLLRVLDYVPAFGQWFQLPDYSHFEYDDTLYRSTGVRYKYDYDKETGRISVMSLSHTTVCNIYDSKHDKVISTRKNQDVHQQQIRKIEYYYNEEGKEVVECSVVDFARYKKNFYPIECQYLMNIKDTSTTKIQVVLKKENETYSKDSEEYDPLDIDTNKEGGVLRKFLQLDYKDENNIEMLRVEQNFGTDYLSDITTTNLAYYLREGDNAVYFDDAWDYYDAENSTYKRAVSLRNEYELNCASRLLNDGTYLYFAEKESIVWNLMIGGYHGRQVLGDDNSRSSRTVCNDCYEQEYNSGLKVYKCDHIKSKDTITRAHREVAYSSEEYMDYIYDILPWNISVVLSKIVEGIGVKNVDLINELPSICKEMNEEFEFESAFDSYLTKVAIDYIENASLKNDIETIYKTVKKEYVVVSPDSVLKSAVATVIELENFTEETTINNSVITASAQATLKAHTLLEKDANYALGLVLYDSVNNTTYTLISNYVKYEGEDLSLSVSGTTDIKDLVIKAKDTRLNVPVALTLGYVLIKEGTIATIVSSDYFDAYVQEAPSQTFENSVNGFDCTYNTKVENNKYVVEISCVDVKAPTITIDTTENPNLEFAKDSSLYELLKMIDIDENDMISHIAIMHGDQMYTKFSDNLVAGENKIVVEDRSGNIAELVLNVTILAE